MKFITTFNTYAEYEAFIADSSNVDLPNMSYILEEEKNYYIPRPDVSKATISCISPISYDAQQHKAENITVVVNGITLVENVDYTVSNNNGGMNAGVYHFTINGIGNFCGKKVGDFEIRKVIPTTTQPTPKFLTYNGNSQQLCNAGVTNWGQFEYSLNGTTWSASVPTAKNAGSYPIKYRLLGDINIEGIPVTEMTCSINQMATSATVIIDQDVFVYDGTAKTPNVTAKDSTGGTIDPSEYTVVYSNNVNAGTATITLYDVVDRNFYVYGSKTFTIVKADAEVLTAPTAKNPIYVGSPVELVNAGTATSFIEYSLDGNNWSEEIPTATDSGTYTIYYRAASDENHNVSSVGSIQSTISEG